MPAPGAGAPVLSKPTPGTLTICELGAITVAMYYPLLSRGHAGEGADLDEVVGLAADEVAVGLD